ncbi:MAG: matrixin family metalloprotease [Candidatus Sericytochromatia bacterium]
MVKKGICVLVLAWLSLGPAFADGKAPHYLCADKDRTLRKTLLWRWAPYEFPIKVYLPAPSADIAPEPAMQLRAVMEAFSRWNQAWPYLRFRYVDKPYKDGIRITWFNHIFVGTEGRWGQAYPPVEFRGPRGRVLHGSEVQLSVRAHVGSAVGSVEPVLLSEHEVRDLAIHEIGHALGLNHSDDGNDVMGGGNVFLNSELNTRNISPRDVATVQFLYSLPYSTKKDFCNFGDTSGQSQ